MACCSTKKHLEVDVIADIVMKVIENKLGEAALKLMPYVETIDEYNKDGQARIKSMIKQINEKRVKHQVARERVRTSRRHSTY